MIEHAVVLLDPGMEIQPEDIPTTDSGLQASQAGMGTESWAAQGIVQDESYHLGRERVVARFELDHLRWLIDRAGANMSKAAKIAGVDRTTLYRLMEKHGLHRDTTIKTHPE